MFHSMPVGPTSATTGTRWIPAGNGDVASIGTSDLAFIGDLASI